MEGKFAEGVWEWMSDDDKRNSCEVAYAKLKRDEIEIAGLIKTLGEIRTICVSMMDGWGQTVTVLDRIRKIVTDKIGPTPTAGERAHRPETFA